MKMTKIAFLLWCCAASPAFSSACGVEEVSSGEVYLPKSLARCQAALTREYDFMTYLNGLKASLESSPCDLGQNDEIKAFIKEQLQSDSSSRVLFLDCISQAISCSEGNLSALVLNIEQIANIGSWDEFQSRADDHVTKYNGLLTSRIPQGISLRSVPCTAPNEMEKHNPINRLLAQVSIDYHSLRSMFVKESYQKMCTHDAVLARAYLKKIGPQTTLGRYVQKELREIPDPDTCLLQDGKMKAVTAAALLTSSSGHAVSGPRDRARQRLQQRLAQKKAQGSIAPSKQESQKKRVSTPARSPISQGTAAAIKTDVEKKRQEAAAREEDKKRRALADRLRAQAIKERLREISAAQDLLPPSEIPGDVPTSVWTASTPRVRVKTRGVSDPAYIQDEQQGSSSSSSSSSSQDGASSLLNMGDVKRLEAFWEKKTGLTYHEVAFLFIRLGGRISEKRGGSSHVTLSYMKDDGTKHKHELWRPHGSGNTFGFRAIAALREYFTRCGLSLGS